MDEGTGAEVGLEYPVIIPSTLTPSDSCWGWDRMVDFERPPGAKMIARRIKE